MSNNKFKNTPINLLEESNSEELDLDRINYLSNLPLDELNKASKLSCIKDENDNSISEISFKEDEYQTKEYQEVSFSDLSSKNEDIIALNSYKSFSLSPSSPPSSPHFRIQSPSPPPVYKRTLRERRAIQLHPFTMEREIYNETVGRVNRHGSRINSSKTSTSDSSKKINKNKQGEKNQQGSFDTQTFLLNVDDDQYNANQGYSSDSSYNDDIDNTNLEPSYNDDEDLDENLDEDDEDDIINSTSKDNRRKIKNHQYNDSDQETDIEDILYEVPETKVKKHSSNNSSFNQNNEDNINNNINNIQYDTELKDNSGNETDIEDILNNKEYSISAFNNSIDNNNNNNDDQVNDDDDDEEENIVHIRKRRRVISIIDSDEDEDDQSQSQSQSQKVQNSNKKETSHDIFDFSQFELPENEFYLPTRHLHNKNLVTYKSTQNKKKGKQKQKVKDQVNKKNEEMDIFDFPSDDVLEIDNNNENGNYNNKSNSPKHDLKYHLSKPSLITSSSLPPTASSSTLIAHSQPAYHLNNDNKNKDDDDDDGFIVHEKNEHSERRRNTTLKELRQRKNKLKGILPLSFAKVFQQELDEEESDQYKRKSSGTRTSHTNHRAEDRSNTNDNLKSTTRSFHISHSDDDENNSKNGSNNDANRYTSYTPRSITIDEIFDDDDDDGDFADYYQDDENNIYSNRINNDSDDDNDDDVDDNDVQFSNPSLNRTGLSLKLPKKQNRSKSTTIDQQHMDIDHNINNDSVATFNEIESQKYKLYSSDKYKVPIPSVGAIFEDMRCFDNNSYKMLHNNNNGSSIQYLSKNEIIFDKHITSSEYSVKSSMITSLFYQAFQSFYMTWINKENDKNNNNNGSNQKSTKSIFDLQKSKTMHDFMSFLQFITKCLNGYDRDDDDNNDEREKMLYFICKEMDILLSRIFMVARWDDKDLNINTKPSVSGTYEKIMQRKNELNETQKYLFLVILLFRMEWTFQLNQLKTTVDGINNINSEFSILSSLKSAVLSLLWHLFSMDVSSSSIVKKPTSSFLIQLTNPIVMEAWVILLKLIQREKLESSLWSTLYIYADLKFRLENNKNDLSEHDILSICEKADFIWFWLLTILIFIRLERSPNGNYILKNHDDNNLNLQPWNLIYPMLKEYRLCKTNCADLHRKQFLHILKAMRNTFYQCHFLISYYNWQWDNKLVELLHVLIEWQSLQLYMGRGEESVGNKYTSISRHLSSYFAKINTDTPSGYFPSFLLNYNGRIPDQSINQTDHTGMIYLKLLSIGLSKQVSLFINNTNMNERKIILDRLKKFISRMTSTYSIVTASTNISSSGLLHQMFSRNKFKQRQQQLSLLNPNHEDPFISFAFNYTIHFILLHCICRLYIDDVTRSVINSNITFQSKVHTEAAWASEIKVIALSIYQKIEKYWQTRDYI